MYLFISNSNWTEWSPIQEVIQQNISNPLCTEYKVNLKNMGMITLDCMAQSSISDNFINHINNKIRD